MCVNMNDNQDYSLTNFDKLLDIVDCSYYSLQSMICYHWDIVALAKDSKMQRSLNATLYCSRWKQMHVHTSSVCSPAVPCKLAHLWKLWCHQALYKHFFVILSSDSPLNTKRILRLKGAIFSVGALTHFMTCSDNVHWCIRIVIKLFQLRESKINC